MNKSNIIKISYLFILGCMGLFMTSCRETIDDLFSDEIREGEEVLFTVAIPNKTLTRAYEDYQVPKEDYLISIGMYDKDVKLVSTGTYSTITTDKIGTLKSTKSLYWPSTKVAYGFKAEAGNKELSADQSTKKLWLLQDRLEGTSPDYPTCRLASEWREYNNTILHSDNTNYKKIPLYLQHQRALITLVLKAGEGVSRKALELDAAKKDIITRIYSYNDALEITPLASDTSIIYDGETDKVSTTRYDAIVNPYNYSNNPSTDLIAKVNLSGQKYSFYKDNDTTSPEENYNLTAGKHLTITVTLGRDNRKTMMSAYIEDWTEQVTTTICDDYGNASDPIKIKNRDELIDFLKDDKQNKAGNVALLTANIDLETASSTYSEAWSSYNYDLNCTLDLGNFALTSNSRFLKNMNSSASLLNGTIQIAGDVDAAIAQKNAGTISNVKITVKGGLTTEPCASVAGAVINNTGTISKCSSSLKVEGNSAEEVGGIAATSLSSSDKTAIIDECTVTNHVGGSSTAKVGGIVGYANGCITNNTFEYGITLSQANNHFNIVGDKNSEHNLKVAGNAWPTIASNLDMQNAYANPYTGIIESGDELKMAKGDGRYRLAKDISVSETIESVAYELDGNDKQIATTTMIIKSVTSYLHDFTIMVNGNLSATSTTDGTDVMAPLAFEVYGEKAKISNVIVKMASDSYSITASNPAGLIVWLYGGATISNCEVKVNIVSQAPTGVSQGHKFAGGIVAAVSKGTVTQCVLHTGSSFTDSGSVIAYYGGIVGGIMLKEGSGETPELTITDCTSYIKLADDVQHGSILGYALNSAGDANATAAKGCQGNWWSTDSDCRGVGSYIGSVEAAIGKRNAITPSENTNI